MFGGISSEIEFYVQLFLAFTLLALIANGKTAIEWSKSTMNSAFVNFCFIGFNSVMGAFAGLAVFYSEYIYDFFHLPVVPSSFWEGWPLISKALAFLLVYDFNIYWIHRWLHKISWAWPTHAVHHSDTEMHFLTWSRSHFLELVFLYGLLGFMGKWLGLTMIEIGIFGTIRALHQYYVHSHLNWNHGALNKVIVSPNYHRWHHANLEAAYDKNFATIFPFYDILFGTYYNPGSAKNIPTGFDNNPGNNFIELVFYPFREWYKMYRKALPIRKSKYEI